MSRPALLCLDIDWGIHDAERGGARFLVTFAKHRRQGATTSSPPRLDGTSPVV